MVGYLGSMSISPSISIARPNNAVIPVCMIGTSGLVVAAYIITSPSTIIRNPTSLTRFLLLGSTSLNINHHMLL